MWASRSCLVIHPGALGDVLLALPALAHLARLQPGVHRVLAVAPRLATLLLGTGYAEQTVDPERLALHRLFVTEPGPPPLERLRAYDAVVSWFGAGDPTYRAHLAALGRPVVVARSAPPPGSGRHASRHLLETLEPLGPVPATLPPVRLAVGAVERAWATAWLAERGLRPGDPVVVHPGAGGPGKQWPGYAALVRRLERAGLPVVVSGGPADRDVVAALVVHARLAETQVAPDLTLRRLAALLHAARGFVGNDSGPSHLAAAVGTPTLALFGPTDAALWAPLGPRVAVLSGPGPEAPDPWAGLTAERVDAGLRRLAGWPG